MKFNQIKTTKTFTDGIIEAIKISNKDNDIRMLVSAAVGKDLGRIQAICEDHEKELGDLLQIIFDYGAICGSKKVGVPTFIPKDTEITKSVTVDKNTITG